MSSHVQSEKVQIRYESQNRGRKKKVWGGREKGGGVVLKNKPAAYLKWISGFCNKIYYYYYYKFMLIFQPRSFVGISTAKSTSFSLPSVLPAPRRLFIKFKLCMHSHLNELSLLFFFFFLCNCRVWEIVNMAAMMWHLTIVPWIILK